MEHDRVQPDQHCRCGYVPRRSVVSHRQPVRDHFGPGTIVLLSTDKSAQIGLIEHADPNDVPAARGRLLGSVDSDGRIDTSTHPFTDAEVAAVSADTIAAMHHSVRATLNVGTNLTPPGGPARLLPHRFNRHTFWCGQSGSGKTYALGVLLEQLIVQTELPIVIFDPNSDFVRLGELQEGVSVPTPKRWFSVTSACCDHRQTERSRCGPASPTCSPDPERPSCVSTLSPTAMSTTP